MASRQYEQGANFERKVRAWFESNGHIAVRSAGSHGQFDIITTNGRSVFLIQCKYHNKDKKFAKKLLAELVETLRKTFPIVMIPITVFVATDITKDGPVGTGKLLMPNKEAIDETESESVK